VNKFKVITLAEDRDPDRLGLDEILRLRRRGSLSTQTKPRQRGDSASGIKQRTTGLPSSGGHWACSPPDLKVCPTPEEQGKT
jgi:hypothetical protein